MDKGKSYFILVITAFAFSAMLITFFTIRNHVILNPNPPEYLQVNDGEEVMGFMKVEEVKELPFEEGAHKTTAQIDVEQTLFHRNPYFLIWTVLIPLMIGIAAGSAPVFAYSVRRIKRDFKLSGLNIFLSLVFSFALFAFVMVWLGKAYGLYIPDILIEDMGVLLDNGKILNGIVITTIVLQLPIFMTIFLIGPAADKIGFNVKNDSQIEKAANLFAHLEMTLVRALRVIAILVVFAILTSSALSESIKATVTIDGFDLFPREISYSYGLFFSIFLGLIYFPAHIYLKHRGTRLSAGLNDYNHNGDKDKMTWLQSTSEKLQLKHTAMDNLKIALTVVAPFITSFLPEQFHIL